jgi:transmembrane sensor
LVLAVLLYPQLTPPQPVETHYAAAADAARMVALPDGSTMRLNRGARATVSWSRDERRVDLEEGEAAFTIEHNARVPFAVAAGDSLIRDVGTEFNVLRLEGGVEVTVRDGAVNVTHPGIAPQPLQAGMAVTIDTTAGTATVRQVSADDAFAWQQGRLVYHGVPLAEVVRDLNRYSDIAIEIADPAAAALTFSGVLVIDNPQEMTERLAGFLPLTVESTESAIVLRSET